MISNLFRLCLCVIVAIMVDTCYENENYNWELGRDLIEDVVEKGLLSELEWFKGACQYCKKLIEKKCFAVRMPVEEGGWLGCFGSFDCMKKNCN